MAKPDVFLSYNRQDAARARQFADAFAAEGLAVWWDTALRSGEHYDAVTEQALADARSVVVLWSQQSVDSRWVRAEATEGERLNKLVPVMIEPCKRPIMFELIQTADLAAWHGAANDPVWRGVVEDVRQVVRRCSDEPQLAVVPGPLSPAPRSSRRWALPALGAAAVVAALGGWMLLHRAPAAPHVMVQPLKFAAGDGDAQLLSESLSTDLARIVVGNDTTLDFTEASDPGQVRKASGFAVTGNAQTNAGQMHATVRLVEAGSGSILWSREFESPAAEARTLRLQMAGKIAEVLICAFGSRSKRPADIDQATLKLFLSGCESYHTDWPTARGYLEQVVARRPDFAQARGMYAAAIYWGKGVYSGVPKSQWAQVVARAQGEARKSLELDPGIGVAYFVLSENNRGLDGFPESIAMSRKGIAADPSTSELHMHLSVVLGNLGMAAEALRESEVAAKLDPFSRLNQANLAEGYAFNGRLPLALKVLADARQNLPGEFYTALLRFEIAARMSDPAAAQAALSDPAAHPDYRFEFPEVWRPFVAARLAPTQAAKHAADIVAAAQPLPDRAKVLAVRNLVQLGQIDAAYRIALALPPMAEHYGFSWFSDFMAPFRADPRFAQFVRQQRLPVVWGKLEQLPDFCAEPGLRWKCPASPAGWAGFTGG
ncbi:MAG: TIR domain-containing protein [Novosphingobium sp.]